MSGNKGAETPHVSQPDQKAPTAGAMSDDELMKIRKAAGAIAEVIEPVQRVRQERTN